MNALGSRARERGNIADEVVPIRVRIGNYGLRPVHVRYEHFRLMSRDGRRYTVLPPLPTRGEALAKARHYITPRFRHRAYSVAPYYGAVYAGMAVHESAVLRPADPSARIRYRRLGDLPTPEMVAWAIPEGVLDVLGFVDGYLFFEPIPQAGQHVELRAALTAPRPPQQKFATPISWMAPNAERSAQMPRGEVVAQIAIPFVVE